MPSINLNYKLNMPMRLKNLIIIISLISLGCLIFIMPALASSISGQVEQFGGQIGATRQNIPELAALIIKSLLTLLGLVFVVIILYGGFMYMTSQGEQEKIKKAKQILATAIIGLIIILAAYAITTFVVNAILAGTGPGYSGSTGNQNNELPGEVAPENP